MNKHNPTPYTKEYFGRFNRGNKLKSWLLAELIDKKQPIFSFIQSKYTKGSKLLDFACGSGLFAKHAVSHFKYFGVDMSSDAIDLSRNNAPRGNFMVGSTELLEKFDKESFDVVTCFDILEHLTDVSHCLMSIKRILNQNGVLIISVPVTGSIASKKMGKYWFGYEDRTHVHIWDRKQWIQMITDSGYKITRTFSSGLVNSSDKKFKLYGWLLLCHYITQPLGIIGVRLPSLLSDADYYVCAKKDNNTIPTS